MAFDVTLLGARRLLVVETVRSKLGDPVRRHEVIERSLWRNAGQVANALVGGDCGRRLCSGVLVMDLMDEQADGLTGGVIGGRFDVHVHDSPLDIRSVPGCGGHSLLAGAEGTRRDAEADYRAAAHVDVTVS